MKHMKFLTFFFCIAFAVFACSSNNETDPNAGGIPDKEEPLATDFAKGADISWVTEMEHKGMKFYNASGVETDCFQLMKDLGLNAVRLRVWVDPKEHDNWCDTADLVTKAKRAAELGMDVMVDFHYSDWWADPGQQHKPAAWKGLNLVDLKKAIADHTADVLNALKAAGVTPKWVQVGNEIRPGMLWDEDAALSGASYDVRECDVKSSNSTSEKVKYHENFANLGAFINVGYDAVKSVFRRCHCHRPSGQRIGQRFVHLVLSRTEEANGGKWDMIGMSLYPYWSMLEPRNIQLIELSPSVLPILIV